MHTSIITDIVITYHTSTTLSLLLIASSNLWRVKCNVLAYVCEITCTLCIKSSTFAISLVHSIKHRPKVYLVNILSSRCYSVIVFAAYRGSSLFLIVVHQWRALILCTPRERDQRSHWKLRCWAARDSEVCTVAVSCSVHYKRWSFQCLRGSQSQRTRWMLKGSLLLLHCRLEHIQQPTQSLNSNRVWCNADTQTWSSSVMQLWSIEWLKSRSMVLSAFSLPYEWLPF